MAGGIVLAFGLAMAAANGCGSKGSSNPASSSLDSLPNADLSNSTTAQNAAQNSASQANSTAKPPQSSSYSSEGGIVQPFALKALSKSNLSPSQRSLAAKALGSLLQQQGTSYTATGGCTTVTDSSTYPNGTTINISVTTPPGGCTDPTTGDKYTGGYTFTGTVDNTGGVVNVELTFNKWAVTSSCGPTDPGTLTFSMNGSGAISGTGLTDSSTSFSLTTMINFSMSFNFSCGGQSGSASGFIYVDQVLGGSKSGSIWTITGTDIGGIQFSSGGAKAGEYAKWNGTVAFDLSNNTAVVNISGQVGWEFGSLKGKVNFSFADAKIDHTVCSDEPVSGSLTLSAVNSVVITFDGANPAVKDTWHPDGCGCVPWTLNGVSQTNPICW